MKNNQEKINELKKEAQYISMDAPLFNLSADIRLAQIYQEINELENE